MSSAIAQYFGSQRATERNATGAYSKYTGASVALAAEGVKRVVLVAGTRPEIIKLAPVYHALKAGALETRFITTGQHREMATQALETFDIYPDVALDVLDGATSLSDIQARMMMALSAQFADERPDLIVVQGDTSTAFVGAMVGFNMEIPVAHVEAGLTSGCRLDPYPEEMLRTLIRQIATMHFAPTQNAYANLKRADLDDDGLYLAGNTVVDAALCIAQTNTDVPQAIADIPTGTRMALVTTHRREAWGAGIESICDAIGRLAQAHPEVQFVWPVHLNPRVSKTVREKMTGLDNVRLIQPLGYADFIGVLSRSSLALTDSGGVQEEAPSFGVPVLVMRDVTERAEAVEAGLAKLVGKDPARIFGEGHLLLSSEARRLEMCKARNPFGDGLSGPRIARLIEERLGAISQAA